MNDTTQYLPPHATEAERSVVAAALADADALSRVVEIVKPGDLYHEPHRLLYGAAVRLYEMGAVIDEITVADFLRTHGALDKAGGTKLIADLVSAAQPAHIEAHAVIIRDKARLRRVLKASHQIQTLVHGADGLTVDEVIDQSQAAVFVAASSHQTGEGPVTAASLLPAAFENIERFAAAGGGVTGVATGFTDLDVMLAGWQKGDLIIVAARPSMGKTALAVQALVDAAMAGTPTVLFSVEMSKVQVVYRILAYLSGVPLARILRGQMADYEHNDVRRAAARINAAALFIDDTPGLTVMQMRSRARQLRAQHGIELIGVDYIQLMGSSTPAENRTQEVSEISRGLKSIARELDVPVIALSQLSRAVEQRPDHRPMLSDLRESGAIEQDADVVMFLYRPEYYLARKDPMRVAEKGHAEVIVAKQRQGPVGTVDLYFRAETTSFRDAMQHEKLSWQARATDDDADDAGAGERRYEQTSFGAA